MVIYDDAEMRIFRSMALVFLLKIEDIVIAFHYCIAHLKRCSFYILSAFQFGLKGISGFLFSRKMNAATSMLK